MNACGKSVMHEKVTIRPGVAREKPYRKGQPKKKEGERDSRVQRIAVTVLRIFLDKTFVEGVREF